MKRKKPYYPAEYRALIPAKQNQKSGVPDRAEVPRGFLGQLKLALKKWELEQEYPHLRRVA